MKFFLHLVVLSFFLSPQFVFSLGHQSCLFQPKQRTQDRNPLVCQGDSFSFRRSVSVPTELQESSARKTEKAEETQEKNVLLLRSMSTWDHYPISKIERMQGFLAKKQKLIEQNQQQKRELVDKHRLLLQDRQINLIKIEAAEYTYSCIQKERKNCVEEMRLKQKLNTLRCVEQEDFLLNKSSPLIKKTSKLLGKEEDISIEEGAIEKDAQDSLEEKLKLLGKEYDILIEEDKNYLAFSEQKLELLGKEDDILIEQQNQGEKYLDLLKQEGKLIEENLKPFRDEAVLFLKDVAKNNNDLACIDIKIAQLEQGDQFSLASIKNQEKNFDDTNKTFSYDDFDLSILESSPEKISYLGRRMRILGDERAPKQISYWGKRMRILGDERAPKQISYWGKRMRILGDERAPTDVTIKREMLDRFNEENHLLGLSQ